MQETKEGAKPEEIKTPQPSHNPDAVTAKAAAKPGKKSDSKTTSSHSIKLKEIDPELVKKVTEVKSTDAPAPKDPDFGTLKTVEELISAYNDMVPTAIDLAVPKIGAVKSFVDVKTGRLACERLHAAILRARSKPQSQPKESKTMKKSAKNARTAVKGKTRAKYDEKARIVAIVKENPCRKGTGRYTRVQKLLDAKTVGEFLKRGKAGTLAHALAAKWVKIA